ncbi:MAG: sigma-70 family RNA polymerase sigma factor [Bdellovibrionales bacterium]|nr:sigma-70 family RNA polymerase sigma factor [Bdellovibrionales bacterium]
MTPSASPKPPQETHSPERWLTDHGDYLFRYARKHFPQDDVAEELVQDTLVGALQAHKNFEGNASVRTWLTSILRHKIIDRIRRKQKNPIVQLSEPLADDLWPFNESGHILEGSPQNSPWQGTPDAILEQKQFMDTLRACIEKLPENLRIIFLLREFDDLSRQEICNKLELSSTNVGVLLHRARLSLRGCLQKNWLTLHEGGTTK